jgi:hypothetical protein
MSDLEARLAAKAEAAAAAAKAVAAMVETNLRELEANRQRAAERVEDCYCSPEGRAAYIQGRR